MFITNKERLLLRLNLQFFGEDGADAGADDTTATENTENTESKTYTHEEVLALLQSGATDEWRRR